MANDENLVLCYNRGCAAKFSPAFNSEGIYY
jgi:hypothetical protein